METCSHHEALAKDINDIKEKLDSIHNKLFVDNGSESLQTFRVNTQNWISHHDKQDRPAASTSLADTIKNWKTIAATILAIAWILSSVISSVTGKTAPLTSEQAKQIAKQIIQFDPNFITK